MSKILVIEDEESVRENLVKLLDLEDFEAIGASNGSIGVKLAKEQTPDLIICDVMMPELDGYGVLNALRQDDTTATIPFIFLTAKAAKEDLRQGMELGASDYLHKPFTRAEILKVINTQLQKQQKLKQQSEKSLAQLRSSITLSLPHELRTPLNGILGLSEMMMLSSESMDTSEINEIATDIYNSAKRLDYLIQNFLLYAELEMIAKDTQKLALLTKNSIDFSAATIIDIATKKAIKAGRQSDLKLEIIESKAQISEADLNKIIEETTDNAFKYSPKNTPVYINTNSDYNKLIIKITNCGRGLTLDQINQLGAYMQFDRKIYAQEGSGLGLIISKRLAELYGGELKIDSIPDQETTVTITLPT
jgi:two-component system sensor histidine kinase/response regulator